MSNHDDRRNGADRRVRDAGPPPGVPERRLRGERRHLSVEEIELSERDWERLFHLPLQTAARLQS